MKKIFILLGLCVSAFVFANVASTMQSSTTTNDEYDNIASAANTREITVHYIKQVGGDAWSDATYTGIYDPDYGEYGQITIKGFTYTVRKNLAYGQERDGRAPYRFVAADYYFNL